MRKNKKEITRNTLSRITNIRIGFFVWFSITRGIFWTYTMHCMKIWTILKLIHWRTLFISLWKMIFHSWSAGHWISCRFLNTLCSITAQKNNRMRRFFDWRMRLNLYPIIGSLVCSALQWCWISITDITLRLWKNASGWKSILFL